MPIYEKHTFRDDRLPFIVNKASISLLSPKDEWGNIHDNIEMVFVKKGEVSILLDGVLFKASEGATVIVNQNVLHAIGTGSSAEYYYVIIDNSFCRENHLNIEQLYFKTLIYDVDIFEKLSVLVQCYYNEKDDKFAVQKIRAAVLSLLSLVCERYSAERNGKECLSTLKFVKQAVEYVFKEFQNDISLEQISKHVGVSKYHFAREFHKATGHTFVDFVNGVRCEQAKQLLTKTKKEIADICGECGFSSSSYFARIFKERTGMTPLRYRHTVDKK